LGSGSNKLIPKRKFTYVPVGPRLARMFGDVQLCQLIYSHPGSQYDGDEMWDVHNSSTWRELYSQEGFFGGDKGGVSYALELDGVNPFHNIGVRY
jgi:hypothetical protein